MFYQKTELQGLFYHKSICRTIQASNSLNLRSEIPVLRGKYFRSLQFLHANIIMHM